MFRAHLVAFLSFFAAPAAGQDLDFVLRVDVPAVSFDVSVTDDHGRPVAGLTKEDFEIFENGVRQQIQYFGPSTKPYPYHLYLLFDSSGSTANKWEFMQRVAAGFLVNAGPEDRVSVGIFGSFLETLGGWEMPPEKLFEALALERQRVASGRSTQFYRRIEQAVVELFKDIPERRALVVLTDGRDSSLYQETLRRQRVTGPGNDMWFNSLLGTVEDSSVPIYFIGFNTDLNFEYNRNGTDEYQELERFYPRSGLADKYLREVRLRMEQVARASTGEAIFPTGMDEVIPLIEEVGDSLSAGYSIGYVPLPAEPGEGSRKIEVRTKGWNTYSVTQAQTEYRPQ